MGSTRASVLAAVSASAAQRWSWLSGCATFRWWTTDSCRRHRGSSQTCVHRMRARVFLCARTLSVGVTAATHHAHACA